MTFEEFQARADKLIARKYGVGIHDLVDVGWYSLWEEMDDFSDENILTESEDLLEEGDDLFAAMKEEMDS